MSRRAVAAVFVTAKRVLQLAVLSSTGGRLQRCCPPAAPGLQRLDDVLVIAADLTPELGKGRRAVKLLGQLSRAR